MRPSSLHLKPNGDHWVWHRQLLLPQRDFFQEMPDVLGCDKILKLHLGKRKCSFTESTHEILEKEGRKARSFHLLFVSFPNLSANERSQPLHVQSVGTWLLWASKCQSIGKPTKRRKKEIKKCSSRNKGMMHFYRRCLKDNRKWRTEQEKCYCTNHCSLLVSISYLVILKSFNQFFAWF